MLAVDMDNHDEVSAQAGPEQQAVSTMLLTQLISQISDLNVNMQAVVKGQQDMSAVLSKAARGEQCAPTKRDASDDHAHFQSTTTYV